MSEMMPDPTPTPAPNPAPLEAPKKPAARRRKLHWSLRIPIWIVLSVVLLVAVSLIALTWYTKTEDFQTRVHKEVVSVLEDSTGGRVEVGHIGFDLWKLAIEVDGLVIHGLEGPGEAPFLSANKIFVRLKINTFISHIVGQGAQSHVGLNFLRVEQPHLHLIIDKDGKTNQPTPKHPSTSTEPVQDTLLDLQARRVELADGLAVVNDRPVPFNVAANQLNAGVNYVSSNDRYAITLDLDDLRTQMAKQPEVQSHLHLKAQVGRDMLGLDSLQFDSGDKTQLKADALVEHFNKPEWQANINGAINLKQVGLLGGIEGFTSGDVELDVHGRNCVVDPVVAQKNPHFWQRHNKKPLPPEVKMLPPDPDCKAGYLLAGNVKVKDAGFRTPQVRLHDVDAGAELRVTPTELLFTSLTGTLPGGGKIAGELKIENWLGEVPANAPATSPTTTAAAQTANKAAVGVGAKPPVQSLNVDQGNRAHAYAKVTLEGITLRTILEITASPKMGDLGLDTQVSGPATAEWGGPATDIASSVKVGADLKLSPHGDRGRYGQNIPLSGEVHAAYDGRTQVVNISHVNLRTPETTVNASGVLGVANGDPLTNLKLDLQARDLSEFDSVLQTVGVSANGKKGAEAIPIVLHGSLAFNGTAHGAIRNLDVRGHLQADSLEVRTGTTMDIQLDSVVADAEYSPSNGLAVASSTIRRNTAVLNVTGTAHPHRIVGHHGVVTYEWDKETQIGGDVKLANAQVTDLLQIAGQQNNVQLTGTANLNVHASGTLGAPNGSGNITLSNGVAYGERYQVISVDAGLQGQQITATKLLVQAHDMAITGSGAYNLTSKRIQAQVQGKDLRLSKFDLVQKANANADAVLTLNASADGTLTEPNLKANIDLTDIVVQGKALGRLDLTAHSEGSTAFYNLRSQLVGAAINADGQTGLTGDYQTQAKLTFTGVDAANAIKLFAPGASDATSDIAGTATVNGPAAKPQLLTGALEFSSFKVTAQGLTFAAVQPIRATLNNGVVRVDSLHIAGPDTDLSVTGSATVLGDTNPQGGEINIAANGSLDLAIAHTLQPDLISSGKITFKVGAGGRMKNPQMNGQVNFDNANFAYNGVPNGLSNLHGTMVFNQNRLEVQNLTGTSGGGTVAVKGYVGWQKGLFADLTVNVDKVRVRMYGLSTTADANIRLQGAPGSLLLSGGVQITRFSVGPNVDFAAFSGSSGISVPTDPTSILNQVHMDIHVTSSPQLDFQNSYATLAGTVDLTVRGTLATPSLLGTIRITDGEATFAGTTYELERGVIYFSNPVRIDPTIDLDVSTHIENYDVTIGLHGTSTSLKPTYRSSPPLTEADIFNLLALGRTQEEAQLHTQQQQQAGTDPTTSAILGGALNATVSSRVGKLFGAGSVKIDPAFVGTLGNSTARITVQEPLSKQLTLVFATNVNQSAQELIQVQYQLSDNTSVVATRDESGVFSIVYKIRQRYR